MKNLFELVGYGEKVVFKFIRNGKIVKIHRWQFFHDIINFAMRFDSIKLSSQHVCVLEFKNQYKQIVTQFGLFYLGIPYVIINNSEDIDILINGGLKHIYRIYDEEYDYIQTFSPFGKIECCDDENKVAFFTLTSGSTGNPKIIPYTHKKVLIAIDLIEDNLYKNLGFEDRFLSQLPSRYLFQHFMNIFAIGLDICVCFVNLDKDFNRNVRMLKPTIAIGVPAFYDYIITKTKKNIFYRILNWLCPSIYYKFLLGGNIRLLFCGSAKCETYIKKFFHRLDILFFDCYGVSESLLPIAMTHSKKETNGKILGGQKIKTFDSELLIKNDTLFGGYVGQKVNCFDDDGYYKTGDLVEIKNNKIKIIGRKDNIVKQKTGLF